MVELSLFPPSFSCGLPALVMNDLEGTVRSHELSISGPPPEESLRSEDIFGIRTEINSYRARRQWNQRLLRWRGLIRIRAGKGFGSLGEGGVSETTTPRKIRR